MSYKLQYKHMMETGRGQELYEAHEKIYEIMAHKETYDMNQAVRLTYFSDTVFQNKKHNGLSESDGDEGN